MTPVELRGRLRAALRQASDMGARVTFAGFEKSGGEGPAGYKIEITPVSNDGETLMLVCFVDEALETAGRGLSSERPHSEMDSARIASLEQELEAKSSDLQRSNRTLELMSEDQKAINEEALSINEEYQSMNEELTTSKEDLQSLNEELTALNGQLQETLERQRTTFNDMQNILYSTGVATIFLDMKLNIRVFTTATTSLFSIIPGDIGRPLSDLSSLTTDSTLLVPGITSH